MDANTDLVYPELSYKLIGILFEVYKELGGKYQEKYYQRAVEKSLRDEGIDFNREVQVDLKFKGLKIGKYFLDFVIDNKVVLELKATPTLTHNDFRQVLAYLKANHLKLGILANFRGSKLVHKRILNSEVNL